MGKLFEREGELGVTVPPEIATRYHLAPDVEVEVIPTDDGILLRPIDVPPWFSLEWESALEFVLEEYGPALAMVGEEPAEGDEADTAGPSEAEKAGGSPNAG